MGVAPAVVVGVPDSDLKVRCLQRQVVSSHVASLFLGINRSRPRF